jgi:hypothetical protein
MRASLDITVPFCRCLRRRPLIGGPLKWKVRSLYKVLQKAYYTLEHLDNLLRPLLFSLRAAMHVKRFCWGGLRAAYAIGHRPN